MIYIKRKMEFPKTSKFKTDKKNVVWQKAEFELELKLDDYWEDGEKTIEEKS